MKTRILKGVLALVMMFAALPTMGQDYMNIFFKNGDYYKFYMKDIKELTTSKFDAEGIQHSNYEYQHVVTPNKRLVYRLDDVDSIAFTKFDEQLAKESFNNSMKAVLDVLSKNNTINDIEKHLVNLKKERGIDDAWSDGHDLHIKIANFETMTFHICSERENSTSYKTEEVELSKQVKMLINKNSYLQNSNKNIKVVLINQTEKDEREDVAEARTRLHNLEKKNS